MKFSQQSNSLNLFAFIAVHTVTKNYHSILKDLGSMALDWEDLVSRNSQNYLNEIKVYLSRGD